MDNYGFVKVAAAVPQVAVADCARNAERIVALAQQAARRGVELVAFPELAVTGYTCADLFLQPALLDAADEALGEIMRQTRKLPLALIVGLPLRHEDRLYNCAAVVAQGRLLGVVPKSYIPNYAEFYEARWFASGAGIEEERITAAGQEADFGTELTFAVNGAEFGIEICEDLWVASPPSSRLALNGAKLIFNLSASPEGVGKHAYLRELVAQQSARTHTAYVYCSAGFGESSTDLVFAGNGLIAENGTMLAQAARFSLDEQLTVADVDIERLEFERRRNTSFRMREEAGESTVIEMELPDALKASALDRRVDPMPFVPADEAHRSERCEEIFQIQSHGLARRLAHTGCRCAVVGISGGLDSTLALLVTVRTFDKLGLDRRGILGITMPGFGTTDRTYRNALKLMEGLGVTVREIPIRDACLQHFRDIGLPESDRSAAYENAQARERTQILMDVANMEGGLVIGTGDLSELALGWATYNGDQMSMYGVNASVPKTLVRHLVRWAADTERDGATRATLLDIIDTPVSPELLPADREGNIAQKTEDLVGPYELHDFFLYNFRAGLRRKLRPRDDCQVAPGLLPPLLRAAVQALGDARRPEGGFRLALAARRLAHALRRLGGAVAPRAGGTLSGPGGNNRDSRCRLAPNKRKKMKNDRMMKHMTLLLTLGLLLWGAQVQAQDWKDALKKVVTSAADEATGGKLTEVAIVGAWRYTGPGIKFEGENLTSQLGGAAIESTVTKQLVKGYELVGIREGACSFDFAGDGTFTAQLGSHELAGSYTFDASTHELALQVSTGKIPLGTIPGRAYLSGTELQLVFPATKLVELIESLGQKIQALSSVTKLLENYENVYIGFAFSK